MCIRDRERAYTFSEHMKTNLSFLISDIASKRKYYPLMSRRSIPRGFPVAKFRLHKIKGTIKNSVDLQTKLSINC